MTVGSTQLYSGIESVVPARVLTVSQVNRLVAGMLAEHYDDIWLAGEVSGLRTYPSGHVYFTLKDADSQIDAVCFRSSAQRLSFELEDGLEVIGHGRLDLYVPRGKYQIVLERIEPRGAGARQLAFEKLKKKLAAEGLFDEERKRPLPALPKTVGIVTSPAGAAIHDMLRTLRLHGARVKALLFPSQVQGAGAEEEIAEGIRVLNELGGVDTIIVGRGGGSVEDLWCFNEEIVARAIAGSEVPVVSGVGHEVDFTIADLVADVRAATPTAAAQLVARGWSELERRLGEAVGGIAEAVEQQVAEQGRRLGELVRHRAFELMRGRLAQAGHLNERLLGRAESGLRLKLSAALEQLNGLNQRLVREHPLVRLERQRSRVRVQGDRLGRVLQDRLGRQRALLERSDAKLQAMGPLQVLGRGYAICRKPDGTVVSRVEQVDVGEAVGVRVSDGSIECEVVDPRRGG